MLARYSKKSDHAVPASGCISCHPRMSMEMGMGMTVQPMSAMRTSRGTDVCVTSGKILGLALK
jgi:hypothetical protein